MPHDQYLAPFLDILLPGDDLFPAASASGMAGTTRERLRGAGGLDDRLAAALAAHGWASLAHHAVVAAVEAAEPGLFAEVRKIAYLTYYEQPSVIAGIRALGFAYNITPLPDGYPAEAFDHDMDAPRHGRGHWIGTDAVVRVDLSHLGDVTGAVR